MSRVLVPRGSWEKDPRFSANGFSQGIFGAPITVQLEHDRFLMMETVSFFDNLYCGLESNKHFFGIVKPPIFLNFLRLSPCHRCLQDIYLYIYLSRKALATIPFLTKPVLWSCALVFPNVKPSLRIPYCLRTVSWKMQECRGGN